MKWLHRYLIPFQFYRWLIDWTKTVSLGFLGGSFTLFDFLSEFFIEIAKENIFFKASALSYQFLLAIFPGLIFLFTLIAFIPIPNFQQNVLNIFNDILPYNVYLAAEDTLKEVFIKKNGGLLSFGFLASLYFSTSGMTTLISSFHKNSQQKDTRTYLAKRILALFLTASLILLLILAAFVSFIGRYIIHIFKSKEFIKINLESITINTLQVFLITFLFYMAISLLYYFGPYYSKKRDEKRKFLTPGGFLASLSSFVTTEGFAYYVAHFGKYNKIYGSIGTLIVLMGILYLNSSILLFGYDFELTLQRCRKNFPNIKTRKNSYFKNSKKIP